MAEHTDHYAGAQDEPLPRRPADEHSKEKSPFAHQPDRRVERNIDAMPIEIDYRVRLGSVICEYRGQECCFWQRDTLEMRERADGEYTQMQKLADGTYTHQISAPEELDPYAIRDAFEKVKNESDALKFLKHAGRFWPKRSDVTWSQFQEWQEFVHLIRQHDFPELAQTNERATQALLAVNGFDNTFFTAPHSPYSDADKGELERAPNGASVLGLISKERKENLVRLIHSFFAPPAEWMTTMYPPTDDATATAMEQDARAGVFSLHTPLEFLAQKYELKPVLVLQPPTILEAIAATIFADRRHGLRFGKCLHCKRIFEKRSGHKTKYCPNKTCKSAALQKGWRKRDKARREKERLQAAAALANETKRKQRRKR